MNSSARKITESRPWHMFTKFGTRVKDELCAAPAKGLGRVSTHVKVVSLGGVASLKPRTGENATIGRMSRPGRTRRSGRRFPVPLRLFDVEDADPRENMALTVTIIMFLLLLHIVRFAILVGWERNRMDGIYGRYNKQPWGCLDLGDHKGIHDANAAFELLCCLTLLVVAAGIWCDNTPVVMAGAIATNLMLFFLVLMHALKVKVLFGLKACHPYPSRVNVGKWLLITWMILDTCTCCLLGFMAFRYREGESRYSSPRESVVSYNYHYG